MLVFPKWPNAPWYQVVRDIELRSFLVTSPCYLSPRMYRRPKPRWNTRIVIVDGAAAIARLHRMLGTQPPQKRVRFNHQTAIRPIPSCKEASTGRPDLSTPTPTTQVLAWTTESNPAFMEQPKVLQKDPDFHGTLNTDPKPPNRALRFLRKFFLIVTDNRAVLRA